MLTFYHKTNSLFFIFERLGSFITYISKYLYYYLSIFLSIHLFRWTGTSSWPSSWSSRPSVPIAGTSFGKLNLFKRSYLYKPLWLTIETSCIESLKQSTSNYSSLDLFVSLDPRVFVFKYLLSGICFCRLCLHDDKQFLSAYFFRPQLNPT